MWRRLRHWATFSGALELHQLPLTDTPTGCRRPGRWRLSSLALVLGTTVALAAPLCSGSGGPLAGAPVFRLPSHLMVQVKSSWSSCCFCIHLNFCFFFFPSAWENSEKKEKDLPMPSLFLFSGSWQHGALLAAPFAQAAEPGARREGGRKPAADKHKQTPLQQALQKHRTRLGKAFFFPCKF